MDRSSFGIRSVKRGDVVTVAASGDYGKPRPPVIVQTDALPGEHVSVVVCQMTTDIDAHEGARPNLLELDALVSLPLLSEAKGRTLRLGLPAVVDDDAGGLSYWALRHAGDLPDFHDSQAWALELLRP